MQSHDFKTTDYCAVCGASPDSATHLFVARGHTYVPRCGATGCMCPSSYRSRHAPHHVECPLYNVGLTGREEAEANRHVAVVQGAERVLGVQRVKVELRPGMPQFGQFLGLLLDERGDTQAIIRLDHYGLMLHAVHPSKVVPVTADEEKAHQP